MKRLNKNFLIKLKLENLIKQNILPLRISMHLTKYLQMRMANMMKTKSRDQIPADEDGKYDEEEAQGPNTCR